MIDIPNLTTLDNGLRVVSSFMNDVESVALGVWINVGSRFERSHERGVAHFLEHMSFKGTKRYSALDIALAIEQAGGYINAYTGYEKTAYYVRLLHDDLNLGCQILFDVLRNSTFNPEEIDKEKGVILQEIAMNDDNPDSVVFDHFQSTAFADQPLGMPILGTNESVSSMQQKHFFDFVKTHYKPENIVVSASGKVNHDLLVDMVSSMMGDLKAEPSPKCDKASYTGGDKREERDIQQVHLVLGFRSPARSEKDHWAASMLAQILGGGMSSRLFQEIREKRGLVYSIHAHNSPYDDIGDFSVYAGTTPELVDQLMPVLVEQILSLPQNITEDELSGCRKRFKAGMLMGQESPFSQAQKHATQIFLYGKTRTMDEIMAEINAVDSSDIARVCKNMTSQPSTFAAVGPLKTIKKPDKIQEMLRN